MTITWPFWNEKRISDVYENIYIRTFVEDWLKIVNEISKEINSTKVGNKLVLDIGSGEGHTTKQILDRVKGNYVCDILEIDEKALDKAKIFLQTENNIGEVIYGGVDKINVKNKYDVVYTSHTNYYWSDNINKYDLYLKNIVDSIKDNGKLLILTLPENSAHYKVMLRQIYPTYNYSEYIEKFYKNNGFKVKIKKFVMRIYVGDIIENDKKYDLAVFYKFIHNSSDSPTDLELIEFKEKIKKFAKRGYLDFADRLIIVTK